MDAGIGYVLIEIPPSISHINTPSGFQFYIDATFQPERYANLYGTVISICDKLHTISMKMDRGRKATISPDNDVRVQEGDTVFFHYLTLKNAKKSYNRGHYFEEGGKRYAYLPYASLFFAVRKYQRSVSKGGTKLSGFVLHNQDGTKTVTALDTTIQLSEKDDGIESEYIMLNNWCLVEPINRNQHSETFKHYGTVMIDDEHKGDIALVVDNPFKSSEGIVAACPPDCGLAVGENIIFEKESDMPVEYELTRTLKKPYWRMLLKDIIAKRNGQTVDVVEDYCLVIPDPMEQVSFAFVEQPTRGKVVKVGEKVNGVKVDDHVFYNKGLYTEFPHGDLRGLLIREGNVFIKTNGQVISRP